MSGLVVILPGDGISTEIMPEALKVLDAVRGPGLEFDIEHGLIGNAAVDAHGDFLPDATVDLAKRADAILLGAVGTPAFRTTGTARKSSGLLRLRKELDLYANLRPVRVFPELVDASPLKRELVEGVDMLVVRELTGDLYYGEPRGLVPDEAERVSVNTMRYSETEIRRVAHVAFDQARARRGRVCSMDKANVLETSGLWRDVVSEVASLNPDVELTHMLADAGAMALVRAPASFDVILTANLFGDILSDQAAMVAGSIGMVPSASLGDGRKGLYEPIHGSAPDIAGRNVANPLAMILSVALMLRWTFQRDAEAASIEEAVGRVLAIGLRTVDIARPGEPFIGTSAMGDAVVAELRAEGVGAMLLEPMEHAAIAQRLHAAERGREQIGQVSLAHPGITIEDAYAVQTAWVEIKLAEGRRVKGHKIGLTSRAMQRSSNISEPDYGVLLDDMFFQSGGDIPFSRFIVPRVEVELAFVLKRDLAGPDCSIFDVLNATDHVVPALEIIDARIRGVDPETGATRKVFDTISDNAANAGVVMGGRPFRPGDLDMRWASALLYRNGVIEESGVAAAVLNHPANGPAWLANRLHPHGISLKAGEIVLGGSFTAPIAAAAGDVFHADYGPLGQISFRFA